MHASRVVATVVMGHDGRKGTDDGEAGPTMQKGFRVVSPRVLLPSGLVHSRMPPLGQVVWCRTCSRIGLFNRDSDGQTCVTWVCRYTVAEAPKPPTAGTGLAQQKCHRLWCCT